MKLYGSNGLLILLRITWKTIFTICIILQFSSFACSGNLDDTLAEIDSDIDARLYDCAIAKCDSLIERNPKLSEAWYLRGKAQFRKADFPSARTDLDNAINLDNHRIEYFLLRGRINLVLGNRDLSVTDFTSSLDLILDDVLNLTHDSDVEQDLFDKLLELSRDDELDRIIQICDLELNKNVNSSIAWYYKGLALSKLGNFDDATTCFSRTLELEPWIPEVYLDRANVFMELGKFDNAIQDVKKAISLDSDDYFYYRTLGIIYIQLHDYIRANEYLSKAINLNSADKIAVSYFNYSLIKSGRYNEVVLALTDTPKLDDLHWYSLISDISLRIKDDPDNGDLYSLRASIYFNFGEIENAIEDFTKAIQINPDNICALGSRGHIYSLMNEFDLAFCDLNKAISLNPNDSYLFHVRGLAYSFSGNINNAVKDYTRAIELDQSDPVIYYNRAIAYGDVDNLFAALIDLNSAIKLSPDFVLAYLARARLFVLQEDYENACDDCITVLIIDQNNSDATILLSEITEK